MKEFDVEMNLNGQRNEVSFSSFQGEKNWIDTLNTLTSEFKEITDYQTPEEIKAKRERELAEKGSKYKILGMNPLVAVALSFAIIIGGSYALTKIKA